jgi:GTPase
VSARTGAGIEDLVAELARRLPRPQVEVEVVVPYRRGDLVNRVHTDGEVLAVEHTAEGTRLRALVRPALAAELARVAPAVRA